MKSSRAGMKSLILKRSIMIAGMKTSVSLEDEFWQALKQIAAGLDMPMAKLVHQIESAARVRKSVLGAAAVRARALSQPRQGQARH